MTVETITHRDRVYLYNDDTDTLQRVETDGENTLLATSHPVTRQIIQRNR